LLSPTKGWPLVVRTGQLLYPSSSLGDVLVFNVEVLAYSSSATSCSRILTANDFEVLALALLRKSNTIVFKV
jgi:hypothetical protein